MPNRVAVSAVLAVAASVATGAVALATTLADPPATVLAGAPAFSCRGSDDGLSEAAKQAREAQCGDD